MVTDFIYDEYFEEHKCRKRYIKFGEHSSFFNYGTKYFEYSENIKYPDAKMAIVGLFFMIIIIVLRAFEFFSIIEQNYLEYSEYIEYSDAKMTIFGLFFYDNNNCLKSIRVFFNY